MMNFNSEIKNITVKDITERSNTRITQAVVVLESGAVGKASLPSAFQKNEMESAISDICRSLIGVSALDQIRADSIMITLDATRNKSKLGANAILSLSLAICRAASAHTGIPLYRYIGGSCANTIPKPMVNMNSFFKSKKTAFIDLMESQTLSEVCEKTKKAKTCGFKTVISCPCSEGFIADIAVALGAEFINMKMPSVGSCAQMSRLLEIEHELFIPSYGV